MKHKFVLQDTGNGTSWELLYVNLDMHNMQAYYKIAEFYNYGIGVIVVEILSNFLKFKDYIKV